MDSFPGVLLNVPKKDRYKELAQHLIDRGQELFWCDPYTGDTGHNPRLIDVDALHKVIADFMESHL